VRVDPQSAFEPDALVYCGPALPAEAVETPEPVIVVAVVSEGTAACDHEPKLDGHFSLASAAHYLLLDPERRTAIHHRRRDGEVIETRVVTTGKLHLGPLGLDFDVEELFPLA
jgi:Uma2 family endonuclease